MTSIPMDPRLQARRIEVMRLQGRRRRRVLLALLAGTFVVVGAWWTGLRSPLFEVDAVQVEGAVRTPVDAILIEAEELVGQPLLEVELSETEQAVAALPWVGAVESSRSIFGTVTIELTEREPVAVVPAATGWLIVDADGRVLDATVEPDPSLVVVDGVRWNVAPGGWIGESALDTLDVAATLPDAMAGDVASIQVGQDDALELVLFGGGRVQLGQPTELDQKYLAALTVLDGVETRCLERLDVRAPSVPVLTRVPDCS